MTHWHPSKGLFTPLQSATTALTATSKWHNSSFLEAIKLLRALLPLISYLGELNPSMTQYHCTLHFTTLHQTPSIRKIFFAATFSTATLLSGLQPIVLLSYIVNVHCTVYLLSCVFIALCTFCLILISNGCAFAIYVVSGTLLLLLCVAPYSRRSDVLFWCTVY